MINTLYSLSSIRIYTQSLTFPLPSSLPLSYPPTSIICLMVSFAEYQLQGIFAREEVGCENNHLVYNPHPSSFSPPLPDSPSLGSSLHLCQLFASLFHFFPTFQLPLTFWFFLHLFQFCSPFSFSPLLSALASHWFFLAPLSAFPHPFELFSNLSAFPCPWFFPTPLLAFPTFQLFPALSALLHPFRFPTPFQLS